jgi:hypothetical protein
MRVLSSTLCLLVLTACTSAPAAPGRTSRAQPDATAAPDSGGYTVVVTPTKVTTSPP